jgi:CubicO group peptidase (beta-lactamase class C family)
MKSTFFILLTLLWLTQVAAQVNVKKIESRSNSRAAIDSIVNEVAGAFMKDTTHVGLSIGIIKDGITSTFHFGTREKGKDLRPTDSTIYEIGSLSKTFTATLLAQAIVEGKLNLGDDIRKYLPNNYPNLEYQEHPIKFIHLANHTSGLPLLLPDIPQLFQLPQDSIPGLITALYQNYTQDNFWRDLNKLEIKTQPGRIADYSNVGAQLVGFILEKIYNKPYASLVKKYITEPLKMNNTDVSYTESVINLLFAKGYNRKGIKMPYNHTLSILQPAGGICSSVIDLLNYIKMQLNEKNIAVNLCHQATLGDTNTSATGLFWQINKLSNGKSIIWHSGATFGFSSYCAICPNLNLGIIILSNEYDMGSLQKLTNLANDIFRQDFK